MIDAGDMAPVVIVETAAGPMAIGGNRARPLVLYFYPKDDTSGCTAQAIAFDALLPAFAAIGVDVIGVSRDPVAAHDRFAAKHGFATQLGSDTDGTATEAFGVWVEKSMYGRRYMGIERATFLIDRDGRVTQIWRKVKVPGHAEAVLAAATALTI